MGDMEEQTFPLPKSAVVIDFVIANWSNSDISSLIFVTNAQYTCLNFWITIYFPEGLTLRLTGLLAD